MESQDKIEINEMHIIGNEGEGDAQNKNGILGIYVP